MVVACMLFVTFFEQDGWLACYLLFWLVSDGENLGLPQSRYRWITRKCSADDGSGLYAVCYIFFG